MSGIIIVGAGGFGLEVAAYARDAGFKVRGFLDDFKQPGTMHGGDPVLGSTDAAIEKDALYLVALGNPAARRKLAGKLAGKDARFATLVHPLAYAAPSAQIGTGSVLAPFSFAGPEATIGDHVLLNIYASVAHESSVGAYGVLAPYSGTHAGARLDEEVFLGTHAVVTNGVQIGARAKLAAAAVAYDTVPEGAFALGNPARVRVEGRFFIPTAL